MEDQLSIGIDLGTTYSSVAFLDEEGNPTIENNMEGEGETPSIVFFSPGGEIVIGEEAKGKSVFYPDDTVAAVKRKIGSSFEYKVGGKRYTPVEISSMILKKLTSDFEKTKGLPVKKAVVTVPAYFGDREREATRDAALMAGIEEVELINEPTAAAIAYGYGNRSGGHKRIMVYDLGGGTFDITILDIDGSSFTAVATDGIRALGGRDWDDKLLNILIAKIAQNSGTDQSLLYTDPFFLSEMEIKTERLKIRLSSVDVAQDTVTLDNGNKISFEVTRTEFEEETADLLRESIDKVGDVLRSAHCSTLDLDSVLLVGGSSRMPMVSKALKAEFPDVKLEIFDPIHAVAKGAAIFAGRDTTDVEIHNVLSKTFGVKVSDGAGGYRVANIIYRNHLIPETASGNFGPEEDGQLKILVEIYENSAIDGEKHSELIDSVCVGQFEMDLPEASSINTRIKVQFSVDEMGILTAYAECGKKKNHYTLTEVVSQSADFQ